MSFGVLQGELAHPLQLQPKHLQCPKNPDTASNKLPNNVPNEEWENRRNGEKWENSAVYPSFPSAGNAKLLQSIHNAAPRENGGKVLVKRGRTEKNMETTEKLAKDMGKNSSPLFPIFPYFRPAIGQYTHSLCPISTKNHHLYLFGGGLSRFFHSVFQKQHIFPHFPPFKVKGPVHSR